MIIPEYNKKSTQQHNSPKQERLPNKCISIHTNLIKNMFYFQII